jgi:uncharacterized protein DUF6064
MPDWTYSLSSFLLFSSRTYYRLFELYNADIWPLQILSVGLGLAALAFSLGRSGWNGRAIAGILAACWLFVAWAYLFTRYDSINWIARYVALGFAFEAALLIWIGVIRDRLHPRVGTAAKAGRGIVLFALALQPLIGPLLLGRPWTQVELFGVAPDPTVAATLGSLIVMRAHWSLFVIPLIWCALSGLTLWAMDAPDAVVMPAIGAVVVGLAVWRQRDPSSAGGGWTRPRT